jgi:hypothetical protein
MFSNQLSKQLFIYFQIQIKPSSTLYICTSCLRNISDNKPPLYQVLNKISRNKNYSISLKINTITRMFYFV